MEALYNYNIKIVEGNPFALLVPFVKRTFVSCKPIDEDIDVLALEDVVAKFGGVEYPAEKTPGGVLVRIPGTLPPENYDLIVTATYYGTDIRAAYKAVTIVSWNEQSNAQQYVQGSPVVLPAAFYIASLTDAELEQLKQDLRDAIAAAEEAEQAAEQAKEEWEQKASELDNIAKQGADPSANITDIQHRIGAPESGQPSNLFEAIAGITIVTPAIVTELESGKQDIVNALNNRGASVTTMQTLTQLSQAIIESLALLPDGTTFNGTPTSFSDALQPNKIVDFYSEAASFYYSSQNACFFEYLRRMNPDSLKNIILPNFTQTKNQGMFGNAGYSVLDRIYAPSATMLSSPGYNSGLTVGPQVICFDMPNLTNTGYYFMRSNADAATRHFISNLSSFGNYSFLDGAGLPVLYDFIKTIIATSSVNYGGWKARTATSTDLTTILNKDEFDDENEPTDEFVTNRDKFAWYFEYHFIHCLGDVTNSPTLTLSSNIYSVISAIYSRQDPTKTLLQIIEDKGWTVASV